MLRFTKIRDSKKARKLAERKFLEELPNGISEKNGSVAVIPIYHIHPLCICSPPWLVRGKLGWRYFLQADDEMGATVNVLIGKSRQLYVEKFAQGKSHTFLIDELQKFQIEMQSVIDDSFKVGWLLLPEIHFGGIWLKSQTHPVLDRFVSFDRKYRDQNFVREAMKRTKSRWC